MIVMIVMLSCKLIYKLFIILNRQSSFSNPFNHFYALFKSFSDFFPYLFIRIFHSNFTDLPVIHIQRIVFCIGLRWIKCLSLLPLLKMQAKSRSVIRHKNRSKNQISFPLHRLSCVAFVINFNGRCDSSVL